MPTTVVSQVNTTIAISHHMGACPGHYSRPAIFTCRMSADSPSTVEQLDTVSLHAILVTAEVPPAMTLLHSVRGSVVFCSSSHSSIIEVHNYRKEY